MATVIAEIKYWTETPAIVLFIFGLLDNLKIEYNTKVPATSAIKPLALIPILGFKKVYKNIFNEKAIPVTFKK